MRLQPNNWSCGPTALYNALQSCGNRTGLRRVCKLCKPTKKWGADEGKLKRAAKKLGYELTHLSCYNPRFAKSVVLQHLKLGHPILVSVDRDSTGAYVHWIAVVKATTRHAWIADSEGYVAKLRRMTWNDFLARAVAVLRPNDFRYDFYPLVAWR